MGGIISSLRQKTSDGPPPKPTMAMEQMREKKSMVIYNSSNLEDLWLFGTSPYSRILRKQLARPARASERERGRRERWYLSKECERERPIRE